MPPGCALVPLNTWYRHEELTAVTRRAGLRTIITQSEIFRFDAARAVSELDEPGYLGALLWPAAEPMPPLLAQIPSPADPVAALRDSPASATVTPCYCLPAVVRRPRRRCDSPRRAGAQRTRDR